MVRNAYSDFRVTVPWYVMPCTDAHQCSGQTCRRFVWNVGIHLQNLMLSHSRGLQSCA